MGGNLLRLGQLQARMETKHVVQVGFEGVICRSNS